MLGARTMMAIILTDSGLIKESIIKFEQDVEPEQIETLNFMFNSRLKGKPLDNINASIEEYIVSEMNESLNVIHPILDEMEKVINQQGTIYYEGTNKVFELPEFKSLELAKNFIHVLDEKDVVIDTLNSDLSEDISIYIGDENVNENLKNFSIITFNHKIKGKSIGTIGIIGPKRMDYSKVISVLKYINHRMNQSGLLGTGKEFEK